MSVVREHDADGHRVGTSLRLNYLSAHPRQTSYAVNDSDILGSAGVVSAGRDRGADRPQRGQGRADRGRLPALAEYRESGALSADVIDIPN